MPVVPGDPLVEVAPQLSQSQVSNLSHTLAGDAEGAPDLTKGPPFVAIQPELGPNDLSFAGIETGSDRIPYEIVAVPFEDRTVRFGPLGL